ncbi:hypothetical protein B484DRAFT_394454 [Ochromonadaceae sp. CCMP2298]|nr:hypothetical protein B484DRAFT_394454 [Ochromonadaceae sp. CCMP2298]
MNLASVSIYLPSLPNTHSPPSNSSHLLVLLLFGGFWFAEGGGGGNRVLRLLTQYTFGGVP